MRSLLVAVVALIPASLTLLPGCPLGCGAWEGHGDTMFRDGAGAAVMLCSNGGFALTKADGKVTEGIFEWTDAVHASSVDTGARIFTLTSDGGADATVMTSPELGGMWTEAQLDKVELDHAHVQCTDLESRAWWGTQPANLWLPKATAFKKVTGGFTTADECYAAQAAGTYPEDALCEDELLVCPDGRMMIEQGQSSGTGSYGATYGYINVNPSPGAFFGAFGGTFEANGTLLQNDGTTVWHQVAVSEMSNGATCH